MWHNIFLTLPIINCYADLNYAQCYECQVQTLCKLLITMIIIQLSVIMMYVCNRIKYLVQQTNFKRKQTAFSKQIFQRAVSNQNKHNIKMASRPAINLRSGKRYTYLLVVPTSAATSFQYRSSLNLFLWPR